MEPTITSTGATLGAFVNNINLAKLDQLTWQIVEYAFHEYSVLIFPNQHLKPEAQVEFGLRFGEIELLPPPGTNRKMQVVPISNENADGSIAATDKFGAQILRGNEGWHTDSSYMPIAAKASILSAQVIPTKGSQTSWADMRAAYDALDDETRKLVETLSAHHSMYYSQAKIGHTVSTGAGYAFHTKGAPLRPLVKTHPVTGRKALYIGRHAYDIPGLTPEKSEALLKKLVTFSCQEPRTYTHNWRPGDLVIWDNRCVLHRALPYDYNEMRIMQHTRIAGDPMTEFAEAVLDTRANAFEPSTVNYD
jgi:alpha-ketoglutarate-dependent taurine dioxygenase